MRFTKMHGAGNDYVYVDITAHGRLPDDPGRLARLASDRHFGIGSDGLIFIGPSDRADFRMRMFNADGTEAEMCGNGIRCVAKYVYDHGLTRKQELTIETLRGVLTVRLYLQAGKVHRVRVDMGRPILAGRQIPTTFDLPLVLDQPLRVAGRDLEVSCASMGNPHAVIFVDALDTYPVTQVGPVIETDAHFPNRTNVEFVQVLRHDHVLVRTWERGAGETLACGTGACAVAVVGSLTRRTGRRLTVSLRGGDLELDWADDDHVYMTGPAVEVFSGEWAPPAADPLPRPG